MTIDQGPLYRYPGTKPFESSEYSLFKGRDEDVRNLYELVSLQHLVVLFGRSGLGKSSLLNAGLVNSFRDDPAIVPVFLRFGAYYDKNTRSPLDKLYEIVSNEQQPNPSNFIFEKLIAREEVTVHHLWYFFKSLQLANSRNHKFILIFDQFEELFTYPDNEIDLFKKELSELLYVSVPQQLRNLLKDKLLLNPGYLTGDEKELLFTPLNIKVLFSIRSDKLSLLNKLTDYFPSVLKLCYELKPLNKQQAQQAIEHPARLADRTYISRPFTFTGEAITVLLDSLTTSKTRKEDNAGDHKQEIETFQLQIVCKYAENLVIEKGLTQITAADLGNIKDIFENHYRNIIAKLSPEKQLPARRLIEEKLIIEGMRVSMPIPFILRDPGMTKALLDELISTHILRPEQNNTLEISHDTLIEPILKYYDERKKQEALDLELREKEEQIKRIKEEQENQIKEQQQQQELRTQKLKARRNRVIIAIVSAALILTLCLAGYAVKKSLEANKQKQIALSQSAEADKQRSIAVLQSLVADSNARMAEAQREIAEHNAKDAQAQKQLADSITRQAILARSEAVLQKKRADINAMLADEEKNMAVKARKDVELIKEAFRLSVLANEWLGTDPSVALRIEEAAIQKYPDSMILKMAHQVFEQNGFYKIVNDRLSEPRTSFFSPGGSAILTNDGLWSIQGKKHWPFNSHAGNIRCAAFSPDKKTILTGSDDDTARLWNIDGSLVRKFVIQTQRPGSVGFIHSVAFSPDGKRIFASYLGYGPAAIWNVDGTPVWMMENESGNRISIGTFTQDSKNIVIAYLDGKIKSWDIDKRILVRDYRENLGTVKFLMRSPDGENIFSNNGLFKADGTVEWKFDRQVDRICSAAFSADGKYIVTGDCDNNTAVLWDNSGNLLYRLKGHTGQLTSVTFVGDGTNILTSSQDSTVRLWNVNSLSVLVDRFKLQLKEGAIASMAFSPDLKNIVTCGGNKSAVLWNINGGLVREFIGRDTVTAVAFSPDNAEILTGSSIGTITIWNVKGSPVKELNVLKGNGSITSIAYSRDKSQLLAGSAKGMVRLLDVAGTLLKEIKVRPEDAETTGFAQPKTTITSLAFSPDGNSILIGYTWYKYHVGDYEYVDLYSVDGTFRSTFQKYSSAVFSGDGRKILAGSRQQNAVAEFTRGGVLLSSDKAHENDVISVAYSLNGANVLTGSSDGVVKLWESTMTLEEFLGSDKIHKLTVEQKKGAGIGGR